MSEKARTSARRSKMTREKRTEIENIWKIKIEKRSEKSRKMKCRKDRKGINEKER